MDEQSVPLISLLVGPVFASVRLRLSTAEELKLYQYGFDRFRFFPSSNTFFAVALLILSLSDVLALPSRSLIQTLLSSPNRDIHMLVVRGSGYFFSGKKRSVSLRLVFLVLVLVSFGSNC